MRRAGLIRARGDTASADALWKAVEMAVARDGRPGVRLVYLRDVWNVVATQNIEGNAYVDILRQQADLARLHGEWAYEWYARQDLASRLGERGMPGQAIPEFDRIVEIADSVGIKSFRTQALYRRGRYLRQLGRFVEAESDLVRAVEVGEMGESPYRLAEAYHNLFHLYDNMGRVPAAVQAVDRFVETIGPLRHSPLRMTAWLDAGELRWKVGWHAAANEAFSSAVGVVDEHDEYHNFAGEFFERTGDLASARAYFRRGVVAVGDAARSVRYLSLAGLTRVFLAMGQLDSARVAARAHDAAITGQADTPLVPEVLVLEGKHEEAIQVGEEWMRRRLAGGSPRAIAGWRSSEGAPASGAGRQYGSPDESRR